MIRLAFKFFNCKTFRRKTNFASNSRSRTSPTSTLSTMLSARSPQLLSSDKEQQLQPQLNNIRKISHVLHILEATIRKFRLLMSLKSFCRTIITEPWFSLTLTISETINYSRDDSTAITILHKKLNPSYKKPRLFTISPFSQRMRI